MIDICGVKFKNPVIAASGTFAFGMEYNEIYDVSKLGGICSKGLTLNKKEGNLGIRSFETRGGMLNSVGLQNPGVEHFIKVELQAMKKFNTVVIANLGGNSEEEYIKGVEKLNDSAVDIIELNISCPNVKSGGMAFGIKSKVAGEIVHSVKRVCKKPLMVKLSPNVTDITAIARQVEDAGADGLSLINTLLGMAIDINKRKPVLGNLVGGLSGPAIKPVALRMVWETFKKVKIPLIGIGGICSPTDAIEFVMAGATAVGVGTGMFTDPMAPIKIREGIREFLVEKGLTSISELKGVAHYQ